MPHVVHNFAAATPEIFLACAAMALLMLGVFRGNSSTRLVAWLCSAAMIIALVLVLQTKLLFAVKVNRLKVRSDQHLQVPAVAKRQS